MTKQKRIEELERRCAALADYARDLKSRQDRALNALNELSCGMGRKRGLENQWSAAHLAADELAAIAKMKLRETYI